MTMEFEYKKFRHVPDDLVQKEGLKELLRHNKKNPCVVVSSFSMMPTDKDEHLRQRRLHHKFLAKLQAYNLLIFPIKGMWENENNEGYEEEGFFIIGSPDYDLGKRVRFSLRDLEECVTESMKESKDSVYRLIPKNTLKEQEFSFSGIFSSLRNRPLGLIEMWELDSVHTSMSGFLGTMGRLAIVKSNLEKLDPDFGGLSVKEWLEECDAGLHLNREMIEIVKDEDLYLERINERWQKFRSFRKFQSFRKSGRNKEKIA